MSLSIMILVNEDGQVVHRMVTVDGTGKLTAYDKLETRENSRLLAATILVRQGAEGIDVARSIASGSVRLADLAKAAHAAEAQPATASTEPNRAIN